MLFDAKPVAWGSTVLLLGLVTTLVVASRWITQRREFREGDTQRYDGWDEMVGI